MNHGRGDLAGRHPGRDTVGARGQVDRPPLAHPVRDGQRLEPSHRPSAVPRRSLDRRLPLEGCRKGSTCAGRLRSGRSRARGGWRFHVERRGREVPAAAPLEVEGEGRDGLVAPSLDLDCGNSGTAMRLLAGVLAAAPFGSVLTGDASLSIRPMERVAEPVTDDGRLGRDDRRPCAGPGRGSAAARCTVRARGAERTGQGRDLARGARRRRGRPWSPSASPPGTTPSGRSRPWEPPSNDVTARFRCNGSNTRGSPDRCRATLRRPRS